MSFVFSIPEPWRGDRKHELEKNHITSQNMGDSFYHIFTTPYLLTLFFEGRGIGIRNVISKNYHMSDITLISKKICDIFNPDRMIHENNLWRNIKFIIVFLLKKKKYRY
jgi:hypothetical protein